MRKLLLFACAALAACAVSAAPKASSPLSVATGTNVAGSVSTTGISGYIDEIVLELPNGALTGTVAVTATPLVGSAVTLASKTITSTSLIRPRLDGTDTGGSALTSDPPGRYLSVGDKINIAVTAANVTGKTWRVYIKYDDAR